MQPIVLYQIPFSHYCDKVRWALEHYPLPYQGVNYMGRQTEVFKKAPKGIQKLTPFIEDPNNGSYFMSDSTPILVYLDEHYGKTKTLFPLNKKAEIIEYCLKLDSQLGLCSRRLGYLYVVSEYPASLSVFVDFQFGKQSCNDWKSYFYGFLGSCMIIIRLGIDQIIEDNIFEKTVHILEQIQNDIHNKQYLFDNQFTAADLTLTSLIYPLRFVPSIYAKYETIFNYCDRIRADHDPNKNYKPNMQRLYENRPKKKSSIIRNLFSMIFTIIFYPLGFLFNDHETKKPLYQYPSTDTTKKANNDVRVMKSTSSIHTFFLFIKAFWKFCFIIPKQMEFVTNEGNKLLQTK